MGYEQLIGAFAQMGGAAAGQAMSQADRNQARRLFQQMLEKYGQIQAPELQDAPAEELGSSALEGLQEDPGLREAEMGGLDTLKQIQDAGGLTLEDKAALNQVLNQTSRREAAGRGAIANDFAARGQLGSGAQLAMSMQNQQDSANRAADAGANTAGAAQKRYFDSVLQRGRLAGDIGNRDYERKAAAARARDSIAAHNAAARTDAARYHNDILNQNLSNKMGIAGAQAGAGYKQANYLDNQANRTAQIWAQAGAGANKAISSFGDDDEE